MSGEFAESWYTQDELSLTRQFGAIPS